jgi:hypothetical protein
MTITSSIMYVFIAHPKVKTNLAYNKVQAVRKCAVTSSHDHRHDGLTRVDRLLP